MFSLTESYIHSVRVCKTLLVAIVSLKSSHHKACFFGGFFVFLNETIFSGIHQVIKAQPTSGFRSLCTTPASCMKLTAETRLCNSWLASASPKSFFLLILSSNSPPRRSSITKYVWYWKNETHAKSNIHFFSSYLYCQVLEISAGEVSAFSQI